LRPPATGRQACQQHPLRWRYSLVFRWQSNLRTAW